MFVSKEQKDRVTKDVLDVRRRYANSKFVLWTICKLLDMLAKGQLRLAREQRNFCTRYSSGMVNSILLLGRISMLIFVKTGDLTPEGLPIYDVYDGRQRLTSLFLFISGYHLDGKAARTHFETMAEFFGFNGINLKNLDRELKKFLGKDIVIKARPMALDIKNDRLAGILTEETVECMDGMAFYEIQEELQDEFINVALPIEIVQWDKYVRAAEFAAINEGQEKAQPMEIIKPLMDEKSWEEIHEFAENLPVDFKTSKDKRFGKEYTLLQLFSCYIRHKNGESMLEEWNDENAKHAALPNDMFAKEFGEFKKEFKAFSDSGLLEISGLHVRKEVNGNKYNVTGKTGKLTPKTVNLIALFMLWLDGKFAGVTADKAYTSFNEFLMDFVADVEKGNSYRNNLTNGTGKTVKPKNQAKIMTEAYLPFLKAEE